MSLLHVSIEPADLLILPEPKHSWPFEVWDSYIKHNRVDIIVGTKLTGEPELANWGDFYCLSILIMMYCNHIGTWSNFYISDIANESKKLPVNRWGRPGPDRRPEWIRYLLQNLVQTGMLTQEPNGSYNVTAAFIAACCRSKTDGDYDQLTSLDKIKRQLSGATNHYSTK